MRFCLPPSKRRTGVEPEQRAGPNGAAVRAERATRREGYGQKQRLQSVREGEVPSDSSD